MTIALKSAVAAALALGALALTAPAASAMPRDAAPALAGLNVETVRWACDPYRCFWVPNYPRRHHHHRHYGHYGRGRW